ncbi:unnamed protein product [Moneuplotes crassus]|uniref:Uncharacterized protein n=1 Tax=Euplotes crassus TaxID=5936 RepID=A0AAD1UCX7_EUPCR|nr:unnamed protein product [Moneuplotes crassus]
MIKFGTRVFCKSNLVSQSKPLRIMRVKSLCRTSTRRAFMNLSVDRNSSLSSCFSRNSKYPSTLFKMLPSRNFSIDERNPIEYMKDYDLRNFDTLEDIEQELEEINTQLKEFEGKIKDPEIPKKYLKELIVKMRRMRTPPLSEFALALNHCVEKVGILEPFQEIWTLLERLSYGSISFLSGESTVNLVYYFCKFRQTSKIFWSRFDSKLLNDIQSIKNTETLALLLFALVMDSRDNQALYQTVLSKINDHIDTAESKDCFYIAVALSKNLIEPNRIPSDLLYNLYLTTVQFIEEYNLSDLSHFLILFCSPIANDKIPEDFWQKVVEPQLIQAMEDFEAHKEHINIELFLDDYIKCLMGVAMSGQIHEEFCNDSLEMIITNLDECNNHTIENLIYTLVRSKIDENEVWNHLIDQVIKRQLIIDDEINEFCFLLGMMDNKIDNKELWDHLDKKFTKISKSPEEYPVDLIALYASCLSHIKTPEEQKEMWDIVEKVTKNQQTE